MERLADRGRRAFVLMALGALVAGLASFCYLRPAISLLPPSRPAAPPARPSWTLLGASFGDAQHGAIDVSARGVFATFLTADGGHTWRRIATQAAITTFLDREHAVAVDLGPANRFGLSADAGRTWQSVQQPVPFSGPTELVSGLASGPFFLDPADGWWFGPAPGAGRPALWRTADGGRTWEDLAPSGVPAAAQGALQPVFLDPLRGAAVIAADGPDIWPGLLVTRDGGRTWAAAAPAWPPASAPAGQGLLVSPALLAHDGRLVLSLDMRVDRSDGPSEQSWRLLSTSTDAGSTWSAWTETPLARSIAALSFDDGGRLVLADGTRLWSSADVGRTWQSRTVAGPEGQRSTLLSARDGMLLVARQATPGGATTSALLRSLDGGGHWAEIPLPPLPGQRRPLRSRARASRR